MRKRSEAPAQQSLVSAAEKTIPLPLGEGTLPKGGESPRLPIETDLSAMCIELKKRGYGKVRLTSVIDWLPQVRHVVAMWLDGQIPEDDIPEAIKGLKGEHEDSAPPAHQKPAEKSRASVDITAVFGEGLPPAAPKKAESTVVHRESVRGKGEEVIELVAGELLSSPDTVTISLGPEKYYPVAKSYNNFEVGMLSATVHLKPGQTRSAAAREAFAELMVLRAEFREAQRVDFLRSLKGMLTDETGEGK